MVNLTLFKSKKSKGAKESGDSESPKNKPHASDSTIGTLDSNSQSPASKEGGDAGPSASKSKSKRRSSSGTIKKLREGGRNADDASTKHRSRSKSKTRSKKSNPDGEPSSPKKHRKKKKDKEKGEESGYSSDSGMKSIKSKRKKSKKDKKRSSNKTGGGGGDDSRDNSPSRDDSASEDIEDIGSGSPKRPPTKEAKSAASKVVASFTTSPKPAAGESAAKTESSAPKPAAPPLGNKEAPVKTKSVPKPATPAAEKQQQSPVKKESSAPIPVTPERNSVKNAASQFESSSSAKSSPVRPSPTNKTATEPNNKRPSTLTVPTKANSTGSSPKRNSIKERASLFKNENASPISPGDHLEGASPPAAATQPKPAPSLSAGPRRMPKGGSQTVAAQGNAEDTKKQRSASVGKYAPRGSAKSGKGAVIPASKSADDVEEDDLNDAASGSVQNKLGLFGGKVKKGMSPKQKSLDDNSLNTGRLRTAFLKQETQAAPSASLTVPSFGKMAPSKGPIRRSTSGGTAGAVRKNKYLENLQSSVTGQSVDSATPKPASKMPRSSSIGGGAPSFSLAKSLGMSSSKPSTTGAANKSWNTAASKPQGGPTGGIKSAYLNATQNAGTTTVPPRKAEDGAGPGKVKMNAFAMFDPSLKQQEDDGSMELKAEPSMKPEKRSGSVKDLIALRAKPQASEREGRSTTLPTKKNHRRSNSAGTISRIKNNPARDFLEAQFAKASSTTGTIGERAGAFSAVHGSSNRPSPDELSTPKAVRRTMNLNALNLASPGKNARKKPVGPKRKDMKKLLSQGDGEASFADTVVSLLRDRKQKPLVRELCDRIQKADGLIKARRLSMRDNDLIVSMIGAIQNDPDVKSIIVDGDVYFNTVSTTLLFHFVESLGMNMHLRRLTFKNVQLGNDILYALATAMEKNFILEEIDMSYNLFTNEGLANFCQSLANNNYTCKKILLNNQTTPISVAEEENVLEAFEGNKRIMYAKVDFNSDDGQDKLNKILHRNKRNTPGPFDRDKRIIDLLSFQAERSEAIKEQKEAENKPLEVPEDDWDYLYELAVLFDKYKLKDIVEEANNDKKAKPKNADSMSKGAKSNFLFGQFKDILDDSLGCFNSDGSFLTPEFISKYLKKTQDTDDLVFDFHGQWKLFKRFPVTDPARELIVTKFVDAIVTHPKMKEFMGINMANTGCGDDFLETLAERCLADPSLLPNLHVINFETNFINERGCVALSKLLSSQKSARYLQLIRLENQKGMLTSKAEFAICRAMFVNRSVVVVSLQFRGLMERQQIHKYVSRNVDYLRQARQRHYKKTGTGRKRNETEVFFDKIAANNPLVKEVKLPGDRKFLSLSAEERVKAAKSFATNTLVTEVNLNACELDDAFAEAMGKSLETNIAIVKLSLETNCISGTGVKYLLEGLAKNSTLKELRLHKQSKNIATAEEDGLADILEENQSLTKLGLDFRNQAVQVKVNRKLKMNDQLKRSKDSTDDLANYLFT